MTNTIVKKYPAYKDSGIAWIGEIPEGWIVIQLRRVGKFTSSGIDKKVEEGQPHVRIINYTDVYGNASHVLNEKNYMVVSANKDKIKEHLVKEGDLIFTPSSETIEDIGVSALVNVPLQNTAYSYHVLRFRPTISISKQYKKYLCNNHYVLNYFSSRATGTIRQTLGRKDFKECCVVFPPLNEQQAIADYLDEKCGAIDKAIDTEEKVIEKLKEYKQSLITETVTKGLDKSVPMKDSGIPWIGQIPQHWETSTLDSLFSFGKGLGITKEDLTESGVPVISYGQVHSKKNTGTHLTDDLMRYVPEMYLKSDPQSLVNKGDFIFADTSEDVEGAGNCAFVDREMTLFAGYHSIILRNINSNFVLGRYLSYLFNTLPWRTQIQARVTGIKVYSISKKILKEVTVIIPNQDEQQAIADYLDNKCSEINKAIADKEQVIEKLAEYKKSLIYECVTGKRMVA